MSAILNKIESMKCIAIKTTIFHYMTDNINCLVIIIMKNDNNIAAVQFKIKLFHFSTCLKSSLIIFIWTYTVN